jgi:hypothetical protein
MNNEAPPDYCLRKVGVVLQTRQWDNLSGVAKIFGGARHLIASHHFLSLGVVKLTYVVIKAGGVSQVNTSGVLVINQRL